MIPQINSKKIRYILIGVLFVVYFLYFALLNRYHILYLEQNQLFVWSLDFLKEQFSLPGGLPLYLGSFFTQFFISSWIGAFIYTLNAFAVFVLSFYIFKKHYFENIVLSFVPVWLLAILQSNESFAFGQAAGFLLLLSYFALYVSINKSRSRYSLFFAGWPFFFLLTGGFSISLVLLCVLHEIFFRKEKIRFIITVFYIITGILIPYLSSHLIFYIQPDKIYTYPVEYEFHSIFLFALILLFAWTPIVLLTGLIFDKVKSLKNRLLSWNITNVLAGLVILS